MSHDSSHLTCPMSHDSPVRVVSRLAPSSYLSPDSVHPAPAPRLGRRATRGVAPAERSYVHRWRCKSDIVWQFWPLDYASRNPKAVPGLLTQPPRMCTSSRVTPSQSLPARPQALQHLPVMNDSNRYTGRGEQDPQVQRREAVDCRGSLIWLVALMVSESSLA